MTNRGKTKNICAVNVVGPEHTAANVYSDFITDETHFFQ